MTAVDAAPWVGQAIKRKEDPRLIMGRARYIDDINVTGPAVGGVRPLARGAREDRLDRHVGGRRRTPASHAVFTGHDVDLEAPLPMAWVPPGIEVNNPPHWALAKDEVHHVGDPVARGDRRGPLRASSTPPSRSLVEYDPLPVVIDIEAALEDGAAARARGPRHQQVPRVVARRRRPRGRLRGRRRDRRAPRGQPPHGGRGDRAARRAGRLPRRLADALLAPPRSRTSCGCSSRCSWGSARSACARSRPRSAAASAPSCRSTARRSRSRGRRASSSARSSGSSARSRGHACPPTTGATRSRTCKIGATRDGKITAFHTKILAGPRRLPDAADADDPVAGRVRDERRLRHPGRPDRHRRRLHQQDADGRDPRRRAGPRRRT